MITGKVVVFPEVNSDPKWYVACTRARHEKRVAQHLAARGVEYLLPLYDSVHNWRTGPKRVQLPLFPGYIFVRIPLSERTQVLCVPSIAYLLGSAKGPTPLAEEDMSTVRELARREFCAEPHPYISIGQRVKVRSGALKGVEGVLVRKKDNLRLVISVDSIMRSVVLEMDVADVDFTPLGVAA